VVLLQTSGKKNGQRLFLKQTKVIPSLQGCDEENGGLQFAKDLEIGYITSVPKSADRLT
jgi:hypothetical protein